MDKNTLNRVGLLKRIKNSLSPRTSQDDNKLRGSVSLDIKGAITLAIAITSFLLALTYLQTEEEVRHNQWPWSSKVTAGI